MGEEGRKVLPKPIFLPENYKSSINLRGKKKSLPQNTKLFKMFAQNESIKAVILWRLSALHILLITAVPQIAIVSYIFFLF